MSPKSFSLKAKLGYSLLIIIWVALFFVISNLLVAGALYLLNRFNLLASFSKLVKIFLMSLIIYGLTIWLVLKIPKLFKNSLQEKLSLPWREMGLGGWLKWRDLLLAPSGWLVYLILSISLAIIASKIIPWYDFNQKQDLGFNFSMAVNNFDKVAIYIMLVILAPIAEEILFRGYLFTKLRSHLSLISAIIITSLLFGLAHGAWNVGVSTFALSVVSCVIREYTGSLYVPILIHMINNGVALFALIVTGGI